MNKALRILLLIGLLITLSACTDQTVLKTDCIIDDDCSPPYIVCSEGKCHHKKLWPLEIKELIGILIIIILSMLAAASGVGGGSIIVPLSLMLMDYDTKAAIALSNGLILFNGSSKILFGLFKSHPTILHKTMIDYNISLILMPSLALGSFIGGIVAIISPPILQLIVLAIVLFLTFVESLNKGIQRYKNESTELKKKESTEKFQKEGINLSKIEEEKVSKPEKVFDSENCVPNKIMIAGQILDPVKSLQNVKIHEIDNDGLGKETHQKSNITPQEQPANIITPEQKQIHDKLIEIEGKNFYWKKTGVIGLIVLTTLLAVFLRGGKGMDSVIGAERCSAADWIIFMGYIVMIALYFAFAYMVIASEQKIKDTTNWVLHKDDIQQTAGFIALGFTISIVVGFFAVIIGIGGGLLLTPFLLNVGLFPQTIAFTGMYLTIMKNVVSVVIYIISGYMPIDYFLVMGIIIFIGVLFVEWRVAILVKKLGRQSLITFLFAFIILFSDILVIYSAFDRYVTFSDLYEFKGYCDS